MNLYRNRGSVGALTAAMSALSTRVTTIESPLTERVEELEEDNPREIPIPQLPAGFDFTGDPQVFYSGDTIQFNVDMSKLIKVPKSVGWIGGGTRELDPDKEVELEINGLGFTQLSEGRHYTKVESLTSWEYTIINGRGSATIRFSFSGS